MAMVIPKATPNRNIRAATSALVLRLRKELTHVLDVTTVPTTDTWQG
jgi:hypothetical protein